MDLGFGQDAFRKLVHRLWSTHGGGDGEPDVSEFQGKAEQALHGSDDPALCADGTLNRVCEVLEVTEDDLLERLAHEPEEPGDVVLVGGLGVGAATVEPEFDELSVVVGLGGG